MSNTEYNGWTNYETWVWNLWISKDQSEQDYWAERAGDIICHEALTSRAAALALASEMRNSAIDQRTDLLPSHGPFTDLLAGALGAINWRELAETMMQNVD